MSNSSIWYIDRSRLGATIPGQGRSGNDSNEGVLHIPQSSSITGASPSDCLISYPRHTFGDSYSSAEMQSGYPVASADCATTFFKWMGCPRGVMVKAMNCGIVVREFVLQSRYYVHFRANTLGKGMNPLILPPAMGK